MLVEEHRAHFARVGHRSERGPVEVAVVRVGVFKDVRRQRRRHEAKQFVGGQHTGPLKQRAECREGRTKRKPLRELFPPHPIAEEVCGQVRLDLGREFQVRVLRHVFLDGAQGAAMLAELAEVEHVHMRVLHDERLPR